MIQSIKVDIDKFSSNSIKREYPYLELTSFNETLPLVIESLEQGDMQVLATHKGITKVICKISKSAYNIDKLLRTGQKLQVHTSEGEYKQIQNIIDYLEVM